MRDNSNYTLWNGGDCPTSLDDWVDVKCRDGYTYSSSADRVGWQHNGGSSDIIGYRINKNGRFLRLEGALRIARDILQEIEGVGALFIDYGILNNSVRITLEQIAELEIPELEEEIL